MGSPAERHITLATPAVLQADRGTESHQPPCAGRDGRGGSCDAPVASHREAARPSAKAWSQQRHSTALLRRSATARVAKRWQLHHELATVVGPEMVATSSRGPELNGGSGRSRLRGRVTLRGLAARPAKK